MNKTLVVSYLPNQRSATKQVLDAFLTSTQGKTEVVTRDLIATPAPTFDATSMTAYQLRGFMGQKLEGAHAEAIRPFDALIDEISGVSQVVFAFPTHNWSEPGAVKTYIDAILQYGKLIQFTANGPEGVLKTHKALVIFASGGNYGDDHPRQTVKNAFTFYLNAIGITDIAFAYVPGTLGGEEATAQGIAAGKAAVDATVKAWFR